MAGLPGGRPAARALLDGPAHRAAAARRVPRLPAGPLDTPARARAPDTMAVFAIGRAAGASGGFGGVAPPGKRSGGSPPRETTAAAGAAPGGRDGRVRAGVRRAGG